MIHIFKESDGTYQAWTDCERGHLKSGRCIAAGGHPHAVLIEARKELTSDLEHIDAMMKQVSPPIFPSPDI